jgi:hypothetical protein
MIMSLSEATQLGMWAEEGTEKNGGISLRDVYNDSERPWGNINCPESYFMVSFRPAPTHFETSISIVLWLIG